MPAFLKKCGRKLYFNSVISDRLVASVLNNEVHLVFVSLFSFIIELRRQCNFERLRDFLRYILELCASFRLGRSDPRHLLVKKPLEPSRGSLSIAHRLRFEKFILRRSEAWVCRIERR